jgi:NADPH:quinone reductase-like Zn-dependent oxidoreductase
MRAAVFDRYGGPEVVRLATVPRPEPASDELLVRVVATTVNRTDCGMRAASPFIARFFTGLRRPRLRVLGSEFAGVVDAVGASVTEFAVGDAVFGVRNGRYGAHAEFMCIRESHPVALKPATVSFEHAASVCDGMILAITCLRRAKVGPGTRLLVYGASGSIGTAGVQLAKHLGAHVTAVCPTRNVDVVQSLGPDAVIDYTTDDFTASGAQYDVIFDSVGKLSFRRARRALRPGGVLVETDLGRWWQNPLWTLWTRFAGSTRMLFPLPTYTKADVLLLKELLESGSYRAVVDRCYPLADIVEATRYVETGQKVGNVVVTVTPYAA